jgi:secreted trypsin-like serine protease
MRYVQYGIVSYGAKECGSEHPGVYTNVHSYMPWIVENIKAKNQNS